MIRLPTSLFNKKGRKGGINSCLVKFWYTKQAETCVHCVRENNDKQHRKLESLMEKIQ